MKRLLLLTYFFPPSAAVATHRMLGFVRNLPKFGWQTTVVAPPLVPGEPQDPHLLSQVPAATEVIQVPFPRGKIAGLADRLFGYGIWLPAASRAAIKIIKKQRPDAILTSSPPSAVHLLGLSLKLRCQLPWVVDFRDPWMTNHPYPPKDLGERLQIIAEKAVMRHADGVVANTPLAREGYLKAYPQYEYKITSITNGFDPERFEAVCCERRKDEPATILHAGEFYSGRDPRPFLDAIQQIEKEGNGSFRLQFLGRSTEGVFDLEAEVQSRGLQSITDIGGHVPYEQALKSMTEASILLLVQSHHMGVGVPAKLYEYLGAGRPILALGDPKGDVAWVLHQSGVPYRIVPPQSVTEIKRALRELASEAAATSTKRPICFTREHLTGKLAALLDDCRLSVRENPRFRGAKGYSKADISRSTVAHQ